MWRAYYLENQFWNHGIYLKSNKWWQPWEIHNSVSHCNRPNVLNSNFECLIYFSKKISQYVFKMSWIIPKYSVEFLMRKKHKIKNEFYAQNGFRFLEQASNSVLWAWQRRKYSFLWRLYYIIFLLLCKTDKWMFLLFQI